MSQRMSDEEFAGCLWERSEGSSRLFNEANRAREAELKLSMDNKFHEINRDDATTIIADLEKENAELKATNQNIKEGGWESAKELIRLENENVDLKDIITEYSCKMVDLANDKG